MSATRRRYLAKFLSNERNEAEARSVVGDASTDEEAARRLLRTRRYGMAMSAELREAARRDVQRAFPEVSASKYPPVREPTSWDDRHPYSGRRAGDPDRSRPVNAGVIPPLVSAGERVRFTFEPALGTREHDARLLMPRGFAKGRVAVLDKFEALLSQRRSHGDALGASS